MITQMKLNRRALLACTPLAAFAQAIGKRQPPINPDIVMEFVSKSHADLARVKELVLAEPMLARASWDWGAGDWETGLGAASHMGRRDIAGFLIERGARIDAFTVCMLGDLPAAKALLAAFSEMHKT